MRLAMLGGRLSIAATLVLLSLVPARCQAGVTTMPTGSLTELLWDARDEAVQLASDADQMQLLLISDNNWLTHALVLSKIQGHVDDMALIVRKLNEEQGSGSSLQQQAVERMLPLIRELSDNTKAALRYLNQNKSRPLSNTYKQYLEKNAQTARELSSMVSSLVDYQESMAEMTQLRHKLESAGN